MIWLICKFLSYPSLSPTSYFETVFFVAHGVLNLRVLLSQCPKWTLKGHAPPLLTDMFIFKAQL